ncbi:MAG: hypothetical protein LRS47_03370 [Desulfurococcales archaeon]|nr:hypothetical protein [Desulfurococcales archaeon]
MDGLPPAKSYRFQLTNTSTDPVLETLAAPYLYYLGHNDYFIIPAIGVTCLGYRNNKGILTIPSLNRIYPLLAVQHNPFTMIGDTEIALIVGKNIRPGPGLHPIAALTNIYKEPQTAEAINFTAVVATMAKASRRGIDLITSIINTELLLYSLGYNNEKTLEAALQAYLYKLTRLGTELRLKTTYTTRYLSLHKLATPAQNILREIIDRKEPWKTLKNVTQNNDFVENLIGRYYAAWMQGEKHVRPPTGDIDSVAGQLRQHLEEVAKKIETKPNVIYMVTGQTSLADLYLLANMSNVKIHLLLTPETLPIVTYISYRLNASITDNMLQLIIRDKRDEKVKSSAKNTDNTLQLNMGDKRDKQFQAKIYLVSYTDYYITRRIISKIPNHTLLNKKIYEL